MDERVAQMLDRLQEKVEKEAALPVEALFDRYENPANMGIPQQWNASGKLTGECGDTIQIFIEVENDRILQAGFLTDGCGNSRAAASRCCELATGSALEDAMSVDPDVIAGDVRLPDEDRHCAYLASKTLEAAVHDWMTNRN